MTRTRRRSNSLNRIAPLFFILGGCLFLTLALGVLGIVLFLRAGESPTAFSWTPPLEQVDNRALAPATVLLPLTGMRAEDALTAALDQGHLENALALAAYNLDLSDAARIGALLQIGEGYANAKDVRKAAAAYQAAALLATISPALSDQARLDTYQQVSAGLRSVGENDVARYVTDQAFLLAQYAPGLSRDVRTRRLTQIAEAYTVLGATALANQARTKVIDLSATPGESTNPPMRPLFNPTLGTLPASPQIDQAVQARQDAAKQLSDDLQTAKPNAAWASDLLSQLTDALLNEDDTRAAYYNQQLAATQDPAMLMALWNDKAHWLALKYRIARGAFGKDLVPDWSADQAAIADAWYEAWDNYSRLYEAQAGSAPKPQDPALATEFVLRRELFFIRWGWSNAAESDVRANLDNLNQALLNSPVLTMHLDTITRNNKTNYLLVPSDLYGLGEQALPK